MLGSSSCGKFIPDFVGSCHRKKYIAENYSCDNHKLQQQRILLQRITESKNVALKLFILDINRCQLQGGSNMTGTNCDLFTHK
jgi:hypothetical protein